MLHEVAFWIALGAGALLVITAEGGQQRFAAAVFAASVAACFGASALYHRVTWRPNIRLWMRRIDHAGVYFMIAGTYTPVSLLALDAWWRPTLLAVVWGGAGAATAVRFLWVGAPKTVGAAIGIALGWLAVAALPELVRNVDPAALVLLVAGGLAYTAGALVYARGRPDPHPTVFGYHELFHALTVVGIACQYSAIAFFIVRVG